MLLVNVFVKLNQITQFEKLFRSVKMKTRNLKIFGFFNHLFEELVSKLIKCEEHEQKVVLSFDLFVVFFVESCFGILLFF